MEETLVLNKKELKMEKNSGTNAVVFILLLGGIGYYIYKKNETKIDTAKNWWSIFN